MCPSQLHGSLYCSRRLFRRKPLRDGLRKGTFQMIGPFGHHQFVAEAFGAGSFELRHQGSRCPTIGHMQRSLRHSADGGLFPIESPLYCLLILNPHRLIPMGQHRSNNFRNDTRLRIDRRRQHHTGTHGPLCLSRIPSECSPVGNCNVLCHAFERGQCDIDTDIAVQMCPFIFPQ